MAGLSTAVRRLKTLRHAFSRTNDAADGGPGGQERDKVGGGEGHLIMGILFGK
jgi:hypothetical protein